MDLLSRKHEEYHETIQKQKHMHGYYVDYSH